MHCHSTVASAAERIGDSVEQSALRRLARRFGVVPPLDALLPILKKPLLMLGLGLLLGDRIIIRRAAAQNNITMLTSLDTVRLLLDVLEEVTLGVSTIDAE